VARVIQEYLWLDKEDVVSRPMGSPGPDIMLSKAALTKLPLDVECKNTKTFPSLTALRQVQDRNKDNLPVESKDWITSCVVWKPPGKGMDESIIYFNLEEFLELWKENTWAQE